MRFVPLLALVEIVLCSDFPTQFAIGKILALFGVSSRTPQGALTPIYVISLSLIDTVVLISLISIFLRSRGERLRDVVLGTRPVLKEALLGLPMTLALFGIAVAVLGGIRLLAPALHNVAQNPLQEMLRQPRDAGLFAVVVVVAGGVREEIQRAFIIHRFDALGGAGVGVVAWSLVFGVGHLMQGYDVAMATALMGALWAVVYARRRSIVAPLVSHSLFDLIQILASVRSVRL